MITQMSQQEIEIQNKKIDQLDRIIKRIDAIIYLMGLFAGIIIVLLFRR